MKIKEMAKKLKGGGKKIGKFLDKHLVQPSRDHKKQQKMQDDKWRQEGEDMMAGRERVY